LTAIVKREWTCAEVPPNTSIMYSPLVGRDVVTVIGNCSSWARTPSTIVLICATRFASPARNAGAVPAVFGAWIQLAVFWMASLVPFASATPSKFMKTTRPEHGGASGDPSGGRIGIARVGRRVVGRGADLRAATAEHEREQSRRSHRLHCRARRGICQLGCGSPVGSAVPGR